MTHREFVERIIFDSIEPTGEARADIRNAQLCYELAVRTWLECNKKGKQPQAEDFIIDWWGVKPKAPTKQSEADKRDAILLSLGLNQYVGTIRRKRED